MYNDVDMKISIFGTGYVGIVTVACFADLGNDVSCFDIDSGKIEMLKKGTSPLYEPGLNELLKKNIDAERISFTERVEEVIEHGEVLFVAVGTPTRDNGGVELKFVDDVAEAIGKHMNAEGKIVVNKSTVPVGTASRVRKRIEEELEKRGVSFEFAVVSNPEFLREGTAIQDFMKADRVVLGTDEDWARKKMEELYKPLIDTGALMFSVDTASAEISKYASNTFLAAKITFINEISALCEKVGGDVEKVKKIMASDNRIAPGSLNPGLGYGGGCFPKDVRGFIQTLKEYDIDAKLITSVHESNKEQLNRFIQKVKSQVSVSGKKIAVWGLSFKANTDDMRGAQSISIIQSLLDDGTEVSVYDPAAMEEAKKVFGEKITYAEDMYACVEGADVLIVPTEWKEFIEADMEKVKSSMKEPVIFDGRNIYDPQKMKDLGIQYISVGR